VSEILAESPASLLDESVEAELLRIEARWREELA